MVSGQSSRTLVPTWKTRKMLLALNQLRFGHCGYFGNQPVDGRQRSPFLSVTHSKTNIHIFKTWLGNLNTFNTSKILLKSNHLCMKETNGNCFVEVKR